MRSSPGFKLLLLCALALILLTIKIDKKFIGHHDWNNVVYANIARNYVRYGFLKTGFGQANNFDVTRSKSLSYLTHYPPLLPILVSLSFKFFGESEVSARTVPVVASLGMIVCIYYIGRKLHSEAVGFLASLLIIVTPLFLYFGKMVVHEIVVPVFSLLVFVGYMRLLETKKNKYYWFMVVFLVLGNLVNWSSYLIVPPIAVHYFFTQPTKLHRKKILSLFLICILTFLLHLTHLLLLTGKLPGQQLYGIFKDRANPFLTKDVSGFTLTKYITQEMQYFRIYFTNIIIAFSLIWFVKLIIAAVKKKLSSSQLYLGILLMYGGTYLFLFSNLVFIHDYMIYYLIPFVGLSAAEVIVDFRNLVRFPILKKIVIAVFLILIASERLEFATALLNSDMNLKGVEIAEFIKSNTESGELSFVSSDTYKEFYEVFIGYYSHRNVFYGEKIDPKEITKYRLIIRPKAHDAFNSISKEYLNIHYKLQENEKYYWYDTKI